MIKKVLFPAKLGKHRLYSERILALSIDQNVLYGASVLISSRKTTIERLFQLSLNQFEAAEEKSKALTKLFNASGAVDEVRLLFPSSMVIFKELVLPFVDLEKISFVLPYEVEPLIPFSLDDAVMSFIVNEKNAASTASKLLVAAARSSDIKQHISLYEQTIIPDLITTDIIALHGLFQQISLYKEKKGIQAFLLLQKDATRIVIATEQGIRVTKNVPFGIDQLAAQVATDFGVDVATAWSKIMLGFGPENNDPLLEKRWLAFAGELQFVMHALLLQYEEIGQISFIYLVGAFGAIPGLVTFFDSFFHGEVVLFAPEKIMAEPQLVYQGEKGLSWLPYTFVLGAALAPQQQENFSLMGQLFAEKKEEFLYYSFGMSAFLMIAAFLVVGITGWNHLQSLHGLHQQIERAEVEALRPILQLSNQKISSALTMKRAQQLAETALSNKEEAWRELSKSTLTSLDVLYELTKLFDKNRFDLKVDSVMMSYEEGPLKVEVSGIFKSKTGSDHFTHYADFEKRFSEIKVLAFDGGNESLTDDGSVQFNSLFKMREA